MVVCVGQEEAEREIMSEEQLSDLGDKAIHHSEQYPTCELSAPGDFMEEDLKDVDCPECLARLERLKQRRAKARG